MSISDFIYLYLMTLFMQSVFIYNFGNMIKEKTKINIKYIIVIFITSVITIINNYFTFLYIRVFVGLLLNIITSKIIYKVKISSSILYSTIHTIIFAMLEILLSPLLLFKIENIYIFNNEVFLKIFFSIFVGIISLFIFRNKKILKYIEKTKNAIYNINNLIKVILLLILLLNILIFSRGVDMNNVYIIIVSIEFAVFLFIASRIIINDRYNIKLINERNNNLKESYIAYSKTIEECKEFKHNIKNEIYAVKSLLSLKNQEKINEIIKKYNSNYEWIDKLVEIPEGLQGLIYLKKKEAEQKKINIFINIKSQINIDKDYLDLCSIIGILIDNAIEASVNAKSKNIELVINNNKNILTINIINVFKNDVDLMKIGNKNYSTKEYKSGLGLNYIKKINNQKIKVTFKIINNLFITKIEYINQK